MKSTTILCLLVALSSFSEIDRVMSPGKSSSVKSYCVSAQEDEGGEGGEGNMADEAQVQDEVVVDEMTEEVEEEKVEETTEADE
ncbi:hypothetical protein TrLO_g3317, partial [Triparma laevis f. longispina]